MTSTNFYEPTYTDKADADDAKSFHGAKSFAKKRTANFREDETKLLIQLWGSPQIQNRLNLTHRKAPVMRLIASNMQQRGFYRSPDEIKTRIRNLKCLYHRIKRTITSDIAGSGYGTVDPDWPHFKAMDAILGDAAAKEKSASILDRDVFKEDFDDDEFIDGDVKREVDLNDDSLLDWNGKEDDDMDSDYDLDMSSIQEPTITITTSPTPLAPHIINGSNANRAKTKCTTPTPSVIKPAPPATKLTNQQQASVQKMQIPAQLQQNSQIQITRKPAGLTNVAGVGHINTSAGNVINVKLTPVSSTITTSLQPKTITVNSSGSMTTNNTFTLQQANRNNIIIATSMANGHVTTTPKVPAPRLTATILQHTPSSNSNNPIASPVNAPTILNLQPAPQPRTITCAPTSSLRTNASPNGSIPLPFLILNNLAKPGQAQNFQINTSPPKEMPHVPRGRVDASLGDDTDGIASNLAQILDVQRLHLDIQRERLELERQKLEFERVVGSQLMTLVPMLGSLVQRLVFLPNDHLAKTFGSMPMMDDELTNVEPEPVEPTPEVDELERNRDILRNLLNEGRKCREAAKRLEEENAKKLEDCVRSDDDVVDERCGQKRNRSETPLSASKRTRVDGVVDDDTEVIETTGQEEDAVADDYDSESSVLLINENSESEQL